MRENKLFYTSPAADWNEATPLGNGTLGAMVFGGTEEERIQLNEESLWSGFRCEEYDNPETKEHLPEIRRLLFLGKYAEAEALCERYFTCHGLGHHDVLGGFGSYQTAGDLYITLPGGGEEGYCRTLWLDRGRLEIENGGLVRRYVASPGYETIAVEIRGLTGPATLRYERENAAIFHDDGEILALGRLPLAFCVLIRYRQVGDTLTVYVTAATDYKTEADPQAVCRDRLSRAEAAGFPALCADAADYFGDLLDRAEINLPRDTALADRPTDERIASPAGDEGLLELYFNFGRYLLAASSRGKLPANLQGIWCKDYKAPWSADYHININIQMNYWIAELAGMPELCAPLFDYIEMLAAAGEHTARVAYGCPGWVAHHQTNPWGYTSLGCKPLYGAFVTAGAWCLLHVYERWLFGGDPAILERFLPVYRGAVEFFHAYLVTDPRTGYLVTAPASSPENKFIDPSSGTPASVSAGPTMDTSIIRGLLTQYIEAVRVLGADEPLAEVAKEMLAKLAPLAIGKGGTVLEWSEEFQEVEVGHRHISQLFALHPAAEITRATPALYEAARKTIDRRLANGGGHTGWSRAWIVNFFARLGEGERAHENMVALLEKSTLRSMLDNHPPFQIDGNFGGAAGVAEMLLQSHSGVIEVLPALPRAWADGAFRGLCARGGFRVSAIFRGGEVVKLVISGPEGARGTVAYNGKTVDFVGSYTFAK